MDENATQNTKYRLEREKKNCTNWLTNAGEKVAYHEETRHVWC